MSARIAIIADDLTGANDTAVQFARAGWDTELQFRQANTDSEVIAVTTDSRHLPPAEAARLVTDAVTRLRKAGVEHLYKKVDSTVRGPVAEETAAAIAAWGHDALAVVCPAFPAAGRVVRAGTLLVDGVPVAETAAGSDPVTSVRDSLLPRLFGGVGVSLTGLADPVAAAERLRTAGPLVVVDAETEDDLALLAAAVERLGPTVVPVGSAGLGRHLARVWKRPTQGAALVVVTSLHPATRGQTARLATDHPGRAFQPSAEVIADADRWRHWCERFLATAPTTDAPTLLISPDDVGGGTDATIIASRLAELTAEVIDRHPVGGLVLTGGDGARAVLDVLGATGLRLLDEVVPGVPRGTILGGRAEGLSVVTKAGGFGDEDVLSSAVEAVTRGRSPK
ncbi:uncharacterized protein YgbK (DUF1537 family) [Actinoalloteichus hoggarensis]|uniref:Uncharacterized protein n=1 Tax=Actinoalloteichus hoggarensis TaxID=1470176 RepID=A0A221W0I6_9PSEU|nr:four-carbon acid sugar kinase family protein [Actinoalloteichus hoggarensis]ASO19277.1 hypothetical protein AHOG_08160 [Actinoalloteichus hoggarensis]MBB5920515.1 uncharacterized protein YgbK (DUF1537 family) [Actinoalloteichus hoggarensis]